MTTKYLMGYYPPDMDKAGGFDAWERQWSTGTHADEDWVFFEGGDYTEAEARAVLNAIGRRNA